MKSKCGIFPKTYVQLSSAQRPNGQAPLILNQISTVLRDWRDRFEEFFLNRKSIYQQLIHTKIMELIWLRSKMLRQMSAEDVAEVSLKAIRTIDIGNNLLGLDMVVRDEMGNELDIGSTSTTNLYQQHVNAEVGISYGYVWGAITILITIL